MAVFGLLDALVEPLALIVMLVFAYGLVHRSAPSEIVRQAVMCLIFGFVVVYSMHNPVPLAPGVIVDLRNLFVGLAVAIFGPVVGSFVLAIGLVTRILIGGVGVAPGVMGMGLAFCGALLWRFAIAPSGRGEHRKSLWLGALISVHLLAIVAMPVPLVRTFLVDMAPLLVVLNLCGTLLLRGLIRRESDLIAEAKILATAAATDPLTNTLNRRSVESTVAALPKTFADGFGRAIIYYDVDNFKALNDSYGHGVGDGILRELTATVRQCLRTTDLFVRMGGDEFSVILPNVMQSDAMEIAERCRASVAYRHFVQEGERIAVTISVGVAWSRCPFDFAGQLARADKALYAAKKNGRNRVSRYRSDDRTGTGAPIANKIPA